jgi:hypothetical protein
MGFIFFFPNIFFSLTYFLLIMIENFKFYLFSLVFISLILKEDFDCEACMRFNDCALI